ncbi:receptor-type tyrosine-protein phosphatase T-like isoform X2 [Haemaphysalis longicornis]
MRHTHVSPWGAYLMSAAVLLWVEGRYAAQYKAKRIDCQTDAVSSGCVVGHVCWVKCPANCPTPDVQVKLWGTEKYTHDSQICAAASHDLRLSPWNASTLTIGFKRTIDGFADFRGSWRDQLRSLSHGQTLNWRTDDGWFRFISPRIEEPVLDLTSVHVNYRHGPQDVNHKQVCFGPPGRKIHFSRYENSFLPYTGTNMYDGVFKVDWPTDRSLYAFGAFVCSVHGSILSSATSLAMARVDEVPGYYPRPLSQTINKGETAGVENVIGGSVSWYKDGVLATSRIVRYGNSRVEISDGQLGDSGLYTFYGHAMPVQVSRVIVRACQGGAYGSECKKRCPLCQNGGVCHDITGACICPPGFAGQLCEKTCEPYHFGQHCSHNCTEVAVVAGGGDGRCGGMLFCLPDPYGCSCYPGFSGIDCTSTCSKGTYGANCKQKRTCHCQPDEGCHPQFGVCAQHVCEEGYRDEPYCDEMYPALKVFSVIVIDEESLEARWSPWSQDTDWGKGEPDGYIIQFKERDEMVWNKTGIISDTGNGTLSYVITGLKPNTDHQVQVFVHDVSGHFYSRMVPVATTRTPCGTPLSPPYNFTYEESPMKTELKWQLPPRSEWQCGTVETEVKVNDGNPYTVAVPTVSFPTRPFTAYRVQARLVARGAKYGPFSDPFEFTTAEAAPGEVPSVSAERRSPKVYQFQWLPPTLTNGNLRSYNLHLDVVGLYQRNCSEFEVALIVNVSVPANVTSIEVKNLTAGAKYRIFIWATTIADGPWRAFEGFTQEEVPEGRPRLEEPQVGIRSAQLSWREPDCRLANGAIIGYRLVRSSTAEWEPNAVLSEVNTNSVTMNDLTPFTEYTVTVSANNNVGTGPGANATFTTLPDAPPPPTNLTVYSASSQQLLVSWLPPYPPHGVLDHYVVHFKPAQQSLFQHGLSLTPQQASCDSEVRAGHHCAILSPLLPNKAYDVLVTAKNKGVQSWSERSNMITAETRESKPGPPSQVYQEGRQETSVVVAWKEPSLSNGVILGYKVTLVNLNPPAVENATKEVGPQARQVKFDGLAAGTAYVTEVSANTSAGYGKPVKITVHTRPRVPVIETKVELKTVSETAITLQLTPLGDQPDDIKAYYVLVQSHDDRKNRTRRSPGDSSEASGGDSALHEWTGGTPDYNESVAMNLSFYMAAKMTPDELKSQGEFTVGDGRYYGDYYNAPLIPEATYSVGLAAEVNFEGDSRLSYQLLTEPITVRKQDPSSGSFSGPTAAIVCIVILMLALIAALWTFREKLLGRLPRGFRQRSKPPASDAGSLSIVDETDGLEFEMEEISGSSKGASSKPLPLSELQDYVQRMLACDGLKSEFISQPKGRQYSTVEAQRVENKIKNRYGNLLAYDHSRVKLKPITGVPYSDYINANYIDGYCRPKRYIATQGPKSRTVDDFWRMVWQENVCKIVMLTGLVENGKTKCEKYWPTKSANYGEVQVHLMAEEKFPDYTVRQLHITLADTTREVKLFHLQSWPDHGVPLYPNVLLSFRKKVNQYRTFNDAPVVVHCSAGIGRTGAYILLDNLLEQADVEGVVDVVGQLAAMRQNRMNVVETLEQYNLVHRALMESVCMRDHSVPCSKVVERYRELLLVDEVSGKSHLDNEFEELRSLKPWFRPADFTAANDPANLRKSRDVSILAPDRCRPLLRDGTFVNAVYVNGFHKKDKFLVTQTPSSKDVDDLWKMVIESGTRTIVTLDVFGEDSEVVPFWPKEGSLRYGDQRVECLESQNVNDMSIQVFKITSKHKGPGSSGAVTVRHFHRSTWKSPEQMVDLVDHVERWQQQSDDKIILVQCRNGCFASGLFCCCALVLEKLKCEQEVDVFYATRIVRENRPQFIVDSDQYKFCYDAAIAYLDNFEMYANFRQ